MLTIYYYQYEESKRFGIPTIAKIECENLENAKDIVSNWNIGYGIATWEFKEKK